MTDINMENMFRQFEKHLDKRLDRIEDVLTVLNTDNKENSRKIAEHNILISQNRADLNNLGSATRDAEIRFMCENKEHHDEFFNRLKRIDERLNKLMGAIIIVPFFLTAIYFLINFILGNRFV